MRLGKPTMRFHVFPRSWQGYQDSCHWGFSRHSVHQPTVIFVEKHKSVKIAPDAGAVIESIAIGKNHTPRLDGLIDRIAGKRDKE